MGSASEPPAITAWVAGLRGGDATVKVDREVETEDGVITVQVEACKHRVPMDAECAACEYEAWNTCKS
jgi:hypothetical protein